MYSVSLLSDSARPPPGGVYWAVLPRRLPRICTKRVGSSSTASAGRVTCNACWRCPMSPRLADGLCNDRGKRHAFAPQLNLPTRHPGHVEKIVDQPTEMLRWCPITSAAGHTPTFLLLAFRHAQRVSDAAVIMDHRATLIRYSATIAAMIAITAVVLLAMGRPPWYRHGPIKPWTGNPEGPETSQQFSDPYTFTHVTHGVLLYGLLRLLCRHAPRRRRAVLALAAECGWEILENTELVIRRYRAATMALGYYGDSALNSVDDILACGFGFLLASRLPPRATLIATILLEGALTLWIRDSLLLNIAMLVHPIEAVKQWQLGR